ncbi:MAG: B12-binding domain-containing radical SAM protein [Promethearchaeota archaeon]
MTTHHNLPAIAMHPARLDALFVHPPDFSDDPRTGPPLGLCHVSAAARAAGFSTEVVDLNSNSVYREALEVVRGGGGDRAARLGAVVDEVRGGGGNPVPLLVGVSAPALYAGELVDFGGLLRDVFPGSLLVAGGYCSLDPAPLVSGPFDAVVAREGEETVVDVLRVLRGGARESGVRESGVRESGVRESGVRESGVRESGGRDAGDLLARVPGLYLEVGGAFTETPPRPPISDLDALPFPDFSGVDLGDYGYEGTGWLYVQRGCYNDCSFCDVARFYGSRVVRSMSPGRVVEWVARLHGEHGVTRVQFVDDNFLNRRGWLSALRDGIQSRGLPVLVDFQTRVPDVLRFREELGECRDVVYQVELGVESFAQSQLDRWGKRVRVEQNVAAMEVLSGLGIPYSAYFIVADARTTLEEVELTFRGVVDAPGVPVAPGGAELPAVVAHYDFNLLLDLHGEPDVHPGSWQDAVAAYLDATEGEAAKVSVLCSAILGTGATGGDAFALFRGFLDLSERLMEGRLEGALAVGETVARARGRRGAKRAKRVVERHAREFKRDAGALLDSMKLLRGLDLDQLEPRRAPGWD